MDGPANSSTTPRTVEEIFKDFRSRRTAIVRALTSGASHSLYFSLFSLSLLDSSHSFAKVPRCMSLCYWCEKLLRSLGCLRHLFSYSMSSSFSDMTLVFFIRGKTPHRWQLVISDMLLDRLRLLSSITLLIFYFVL